MAPGVLEHHGLVHHRKLEVGRRVVDRNARILGERDGDEPNEREPQGDAQA